MPELRTVACACQMLLKCSKSSSSSSFSSSSVFRAELRARTRKITQHPALPSPPIRPLPCSMVSLGFNSTAKMHQPIRTGVRSKFEIDISALNTADAIDELGHHFSGPLIPAIVAIGDRGPDNTVQSDNDVRGLLEHFQFGFG